MPSLVALACLLKKSYKRPNSVWAECTPPPPGLNRVNNGDDEGDDDDDDDEEDDNVDVSKDGNDYDNGIILFFPVKTF